MDNIDELWSEMVTKAKLSLDINWTVTEDEVIVKIAERLAAAEADAKQWRERVMQMASGELRHRNAGDCPDMHYPKSRDRRCPVCQMMGEA